MYSFLFFIVISIICNLAGGFEYFLWDVYGDIRKGNFTYYSMSYDGTILVKLISLTGDCDLYVSQFTNKPTYEPESYCLQSVTCGLDSVIVPKKFNRPVGIGIFGHPSHDVSLYHLAFYRTADYHDIFNYDPENITFETFKSDNVQDNFDSSEVGGKSYFWVFFRYLIVLLIDCIF